MKALGGILAASALLCATMAAAQDRYRPTGSRIARPAPAKISENTNLSEADRAMRAVNEFARCVIRHDGDKIRPLLSLEPRELSQSEERLLLQPRCVENGQLGMPDQVLRGAVARELFFEDFAGKELIFAPEGVNYFEFVTPGQTEAASSATLLDFAGCVVRDAPSPSVDFISSIPGEPAEAEALGALMPHLGPCMHEGIEVEFNKTMLRSYISEALYWESVSGRDAKDATEARQ